MHCLRPLLVLIGLTTACVVAEVDDNDNDNDNDDSNTAGVSVGGFSSGSAGGSQPGGS